MKNREKQIEEMAKVLEGVPRWEEARLGYYKSKAIAFYNAGYRKSSEVAREIFAEIESLADSNFARNHGVVLVSKKGYEELKKKYAESEKDDGQK